MVTSMGAAMKDPMYSSLESLRLSIPYGKMGLYMAAMDFI